MNKIIINMDKLFKSQKEQYTKMIEQKIKAEEEIIKAAELLIENPNKIDSNHEELVIAKLKLNISKQRIIMLNKLKNLYEYSRIQAMSDVEIETYKKEIILEYTSIIDELKEKNESPEKEVGKLKNELKTACNKLKNVSTLSITDEIVTSTSSITQSIDNLRTTFDIIGNNKEKIGTITKEQMDFVNMTPQEIRKAKLNEINDDDLKQVIQKISKYGVTLQEKISKKILQEPEKIKIFIEQSQLYNTLLKLMNFLSMGAYISYANSPILNDVLAEKYFYNLLINGLSIFELFETVADELEKFNSEFYRIKAIFEQEFTNEKMELLLDDINHETKQSPEINEEFFNKHIDKYPKHMFEELMFCTDKLKKLEKKLWIFNKLLIFNKSLMFENCVFEKNRLERIIKNKHEQIYEHINSWYSSSLKEMANLLGTDELIFTDDKAKSTADLEIIHNRIVEAEEKMKTFNQNFIDCRERFSSRCLNNEDEMRRVTNTAISLAGDEYINAEIMLYGKPKTIEQKGNTFSLYGENEDTLIEQALNAEQAGIIWQVQSMAQKEAYYEEMKLRKIPAEQIKQMIK